MSKKEVYNLGLQFKMLSNELRSEHPKLVVQTYFIQKKRIGRAKMPVIGSYWTK